MGPKSHIAPHFLFRIIDRRDLKRYASPKSEDINKQKERQLMDITSLIIELISGAVGGNVAGAAMKEKSLGLDRKSVV